MPTYILKYRPNISSNSPSFLTNRFKDIDFLYDPENVACLKETRGCTDKEALCLDILGFQKDDKELGTKNLDQLAVEFLKSKGLEFKETDFTFLTSYREGDNLYGIKARIRRDPLKILTRKPGVTGIIEAHAKLYDTDTDTLLYSIQM